MFEVLYSPVRIIKSVFSIFEDKEAKGLLVFVILVIALGSLFFRHFEHWNLLDSFYFSVTTLTTVGFGDLSPITNAGKVFTVFYIIFGVGIIFGLINIIAEHARKNYVKQTEGILEDLTNKVMEHRPK